MSYYAIELLFAQHIARGNKSINDVPDAIKENVRTILRNEFNIEA